MSDVETVEKVFAAVVALRFRALFNDNAPNGEEQNGALQAGRPRSRFPPIVLESELIPGSFEHALDILIDTEIDLSRLAKRFCNDETGAPIYDPAVMLKIVLLACSRGVISSRRIERLCRENVLFMAISGDSAPQFSTIATFVRELGEEASAIFTRVLLTCDRQGLIGRQMFAIDGVKLPSNADKQRSGTAGACS